MSLSTQPYKGTRDFYPEDMRIQKYVFNTMRKAVEAFGYEEYDAPLIEPLELYLAKTGQEIVTEQTYEFTDRGNRRVAIRPEMTPTVARMVAAKRQELSYPLRWYSIPNLWRYERPQRGRLREHWQLNVDLFGIAESTADMEVVAVADAVMQAFGAKRNMYTIKINSRKLTDYFLSEVVKLDDIQVATAIKVIDRMHKIEYAQFVSQIDGLLQPGQRDSGTEELILSYLQATTMDNLPEALKLHASYEELQAVINHLHSTGISNVVFDPTLMRGFDYYTDIVFEVFDTDPANNRSMFGGGRYDGLVGLFGVDPVPTVGFGMGDVVLRDFLITHNLLPVLKTQTDVYVVIIGDVLLQAQKAITDLRGMGLKVAVDLSGKKIEKQIKTASKKNIPYVLFIGENELKENSFTIKNLFTGSEETHSLERIVSILKDHRNQVQ